MPADRERLDLRAAEAAETARCSRCSTRLLDEPEAIVTGLLRVVGQVAVRHFSLCGYCGLRLLSVLNGSPM